jgi:hypothetical protein
MNIASSTNVKNNVNNEALKIAELLHNFCYISSTSNDITMSFKSLKLINKQLSNDFLLEHLINNIDLILTKYDIFNFHLNIKSISILDVDKNKDFIQKASIVLKEKYPCKLDTCYIYEAPNMFSNIFKLIFAFVDKETQKKIKIVESSPL